MNPWIITIFAALVVIAGGWFLGQALARVFNGAPKTERVAQAPTAQPVVTPLASASPAATPQPSATAQPSPTAPPTASEKPKPTPQPTPTATPAVVSAPPQTAAPTIAPTATPAAVATSTPALRHTQPIARRPEPASPAAAQPSEGAATRVVRAYIDALRRSDPATASTYLGNGSPDESFIDSGTRITSITEAANGDGSYKVSVDMQTAKGEYYETFTVASDRILEKTAIKP